MQKPNFLNASTIITAEEIEEEQTVFTFEAGTLKFTIHAGNCVHHYNDIQPLLEGKDYDYSDGHFDITQRNGETTFSLHSEGTAFDITVPATECTYAFNSWVHGPLSRDIHTPDLPCSDCGKIMTWEDPLCTCTENKTL